MSQAKIDCGTLTQNADKKFVGKVALIGRLDGTLQLTPRPKSERDSENSPNYDVSYQPRGAQPFFEMGAAWIKPGERVGEFLSMTLTHPDWSSDLNLVAFPPAKERGETSWRVVFSRPRAANVQAQEAA
jgi:uncharacterized protein (DUF736 family)